MKDRATEAKEILERIEGVLAYSSEQMENTAPYVFWRLLKDCKAFIEQSVIKEKCDGDRILAWIDNPNREPAHLSFTDGLERQIAYRFEQATLPKQQGE